MGADRTGCSHDLQSGQQGVQVTAAVITRARQQRKEKRRAAVLLVRDSSARRKGGACGTYDRLRRSETQFRTSPASSTTIGL